MKGLILIYGVAGLGSIAALRSPMIGLFIYVGFAVLRPQGIWGWAGDLTGVSLVVGIATLIGWLFKGFGNLRFGRGRPIVIALCVFFVWAAFSAMQAADKDVAYDSLITMAKFVMPFLIGVTVLETEEQSRWMLWVIVLAQGYVGFEMNLAYLKGYNLAGDGFAGMDNNCFGVALVSTVGPALALVMGAKKWWERLLGTAAAALMLHTILLTFSRGALVGLLIVGATAFVIMPKRPKYIAALGLALIVAVRFTGPQLAERYSSTFASADERDSSSESRIDLWRDCFDIALGRPLFGVGPANFPVIAKDRGWTEGKQAHSVWMQTLAENGFPGVAALFIFFALAVVKLWPLARMKQTPENRYTVAVATGIITSIAGFMVAGQFVSLAGLEIPYYTTMVGVVLLKSAKPSSPVPVPQSTPVRTSAPRAPRFALRGLN
jgi:probable O-glycosylation ligase (exosortase A-associated)